jgi:methyl-accepting chemotaxis protein
MSTALAVPVPGTVALPTASQPLAAAASRVPPSTLHAPVMLGFAAVLLPLAALFALACVQLAGAIAWLVAGLALAAIGATLCFAAWLVRGVIGPLATAGSAAARLRAGDLSEQGSVRGTAEMRRLLQGLHVVRQRMFDVVREVRSGTGSVAINAGQINRDNDALAKSTATQADSLQATAASMEQLAAAVRQNAGIAERAHVLVRTAADRAEHGGRVMRDVVDTMGSIRGSSHSIRDIIGVIDAIAFQTNILALNAAVEAARAGEQGRGFAVVAAEVRKLAKRCADAAQEVKALIGASVQKVDAGASHVDEASQAMSQIVAGVREVATLIAQIDTASREQSSGIDTINQAVARIDTTTQENTELVKGAARTASALRARAVALLKAVEVFQLGARGEDDVADAIALVNAGCEFLRGQGRAAFIEEVNRLDAGRFVARDLYLMVLTLDGTVFVAHGNNPARLGTGPNVKDAGGKYFARDIVQLARQRGEGWVDYKWEHPVTGAISTKSGFVRREGDLAIFCAVFRN